jgi:hypothetical protein
MIWFGSKTVATWRRPAPAPAWIDPSSTHPKPVYHHDVSCRVYLVYVLDPRTNFTTMTLGYVGETIVGRELVRFGEHVGDGTPSKPGQPWSDTIPEHDPRRAIAAGIFQVLDAVYSSKEKVWVAERATCARLRPLYNDEYNRHNRDRITLMEARQARADRDRANGVPLEQTWAYLHDQHEQNRARRHAPAAAAPARSWLPGWRWRVPRLTRAEWRRVRVCGGWLGASLVLWWLAARYVHGVAGWRLGGASALLVAVAMLWWRRPARRSLRRAGNGLLRAAAFALSLYLLFAPAVHALMERARAGR